MRRRSRSLLVAVAASAAVALAAGPAWGAKAGDPLDEVPALGEYIEDVPTASGKKSSARPKPGKKEPTRSTPLPPRVEEEIDAQPAPVARSLRKITTSQRYGAQDKAPAAERERVRAALRAEPDSTPSATPQALGTVVGIAATGGDAHLTALLFVILASTGAAVLLAALRAFRARG